MKRFLLLCCWGIVLTCNAAETKNPALQNFIGTWTGIGKQDDNSAWTIKIAINSGRYLIDYPSLHCGGELKLRKVKKDILIFTEYLTYGFKECYNNGKTVLIRTPDGNLRYYWYFENGGRKAAVGTLKREKLAE